MDFESVSHAVEYMDSLGVPEGSRAINDNKYMYRQGVCCDDDGEADGEE